MFNPNLDEQTAVALCVVINNHINALRTWERKLRQPFTPEAGKVTYMYRTTPVYPVPTLSSSLHVVSSCATASRDLLRIVEMFAKVEKVKEEL